MQVRNKQFRLLVTELFKPLRFIKEYFQTSLLIKSRFDQNTFMLRDNSLRNLDIPNDLGVIRN